MKSIDHNFDISKELGLEDLPNEIWKDIQGYEDYYQVSNLGRVKSLERKFSSSEKILKLLYSIDGYPRICLRKDKKNKYYFVHRLVALAFIPNPENKSQIDHINTIKTDNRVENLHWVSASENMHNPLTRLQLSKSSTGKKMSKEAREKMRIKKLGTKASEETKIKMSAQRKGKNNPKARKIINLSTLDIFYSLVEAERFYSLTRGSIYKAINQHTKRAGFYWGYYTE